MNSKKNQFIVAMAMGARVLVNLPSKTTNY